MLILCAKTLSTGSRPDSSRETDLGTLKSCFRDI